MRNSEAITVWCDESEVIKTGKIFHVIGTLITNSSNEEFDVMKKLVDAREKTGCWNVLHGSELKFSDKGRIELIKKWIKIFKENKIFFHVFLYKEDRRFAPGGNFEKYFAKQTAFSLGLKMKKSGCLINTVFSKVGTVTFLHDQRTDVVGSSLGSEYKEQIKKQLRLQSGRSDDLTVRFSFLDSDCFNLMQLCDVLLYMIKLRIEKESGNILSKEKQNILDLWERDFIDSKMKTLGDYKFSEKFNFFRDL